MFSVLLSCPFPGPWSRESGLFLGFLLVCVIGVFGLLASSVPILECMRQEENARNSLPCSCLGSEFPGLPDFFLFTLQHLLLFILYVTSRVLVGRIGRMRYYSLRISPESEVSMNLNMTPDLQCT